RGARAAAGTSTRVAGTIPSARHIGAAATGACFTDACFVKPKAMLGRSTPLRSASALPYGCYSIGRLSGLAYAPQSASRSTCQRALSMLPRYERMAHGSIGHACNGFSGAAGAQPKPIYGGSALQWARFNLAKYRVEGGVVPFTLGPKFLDARAACT